MADQSSYLHVLTAVSPAVALALSALALIISLLNFRRKSGAEVRGYHIIASDITSSEKYVCKVHLENDKDKALVVYGIYLYLAPNVSIELEKFDEDQFLVIPPYSAIRRLYDPIIAYSFNMNLIDLSNLLDWSNKKAQLFLVTRHGKVFVKKRYVRFHPAGTYLRNHFQLTPYPLRILYSGQSFGDKTKFVVKLERPKEGTENIAITGDEIKQQ